jgi:hypothetical protein
MDWGCSHEVPVGSVPDLDLIGSLALNPDSGRHK